MIGVRQIDVCLRLVSALHAAPPSAGHSAQPSALLGLPDSDAPTIRRTLPSGATTISRMLPAAEAASTAARICVTRGLPVTFFLDREGDFFIARLRSCKAQP